MMLRDRIAPALRTLGFKGSGPVFSLPNEKHHAMLGFQKSVSSTASEIRFTVNALVVSKDAWKKAREEWSYIPQRPSPNASWGDFVWQSRMGHLLPEREDAWWRLSASADVERLAGELVDAIQEYMLPEIRQRIGGA